MKLKHRLVVEPGRKARLADRNPDETPGVKDKAAVECLEELNMEFPPPSMDLAQVRLK